MPLTPGTPVASPHIKGKALPFSNTYPRIVPASAGIFASLDAMIEISRLQCGFRPDLISQRALDELYKPQAICTDIHKFAAVFPQPLHELELTYGLGWRILKSKKHPGKDLIFHGGYVNGIRSFIGFIPSEKISIIFLVNEDTRFHWNVVIDLWKEMIGF